MSHYDDDEYYGDWYHEEFLRKDLDDTIFVYSEDA